MKWQFDKEGFFFSLGLIIFVFFSILTVKIYADFYADVFLSPELRVFERNLASLPSLIKEAERIKLAFVGDIMLDRGPELRVNKLAGGDYRFPFLLIADQISKYDFLFGNLEGPMSDVGRDSGSFISFRFDEKATQGLLYAGFDALSVANNHSGDWGRAAFEDTIVNLETAKIAPVGDSLQPKIVEVGGLKIALVAFADFPGPGMRATDENIIEALDNSRLKADLIVASCHFG